MVKRIKPLKFLEIGQGVRPMRGDSLPKVDFFYIFGAAFPSPAPIGVKFRVAKRNQVPLGGAKFHVNRSTSRPCGAKTLIFGL